MASIDEIRETLLRQKQELQLRMEKADADLRRKNKPLERELVEQSTDRENDNVLEGLIRTSKEEILMINRALKRLDLGTYTVCSSCGLDIPENRLRAVPYTDLCVNCASRNS